MMRLLRGKTASWTVGGGGGSMTFADTDTGTVGNTGVGPYTLATDPLSIGAADANRTVIAAVGFGSTGTTPALDMQMATTSMTTFGAQVNAPNSQSNAAFFRLDVATGTTESFEANLDGIVSFRGIEAMIYRFVNATSFIDGGGDTEGNPGSTLTVALTGLQVDDVVLAICQSQTVTAATGTYTWGNVTERGIVTEGGDREASFADTTITAGTTLTVTCVRSGNCANDGALKVVVVRP